MTGKVSPSVLKELDKVDLMFGQICHFRITKCQVIKLPTSHAKTQYSFNHLTHPGDPKPTCSNSILSGLNAKMFTLLMIELYNQLGQSMILG